MNCYEILLKLPKKNIINVLYEALEEMQQYNGRTVTHCIMTAMGVEEYEDGKWRGNLKKVRKHTKETAFITE